MDRVETETVDLVLVRPQLSVLNCPFAHALLRVIDRVAPERVVAVREIGSEGGDRLRAGADVVVDDVEDHSEPLPVRRIDEASEPVRPAVHGMCREVVQPVVAPVAVAGEGRDGHQLDRRDAELAQAAQPRDDAVEGAVGRERADVQLVDDQLVEVQSSPGRNVERARVDDARGTAHAFGLPARAGIGKGRSAVEHERVVVPGPSGHVAGPGPVVSALERVLCVIESDRDRLGTRSPHAELDLTRPDRDCAQLLHRARLPVRP